MLETEVSKDMFSDLWRRMVRGTGTNCGFVFFLLFLWNPWTPVTMAQLHIPLTTQEALPPGVAGLTRAQDPVSAGIPLADAAAISSISQLGLTGAAVGQFRVLGRWPSRGRRLAAKQPFRWAALTAEVED